MKKLFYHTALIIIFILLNQCSGYKPIFATSDLQFRIADYKIEGDKSLGNKLYSKLRILSKSKNESADLKNIAIIFEVQKTKSSTAKDSAGKILEYKITLNTKIEAKDFITDERILKQNFNSSLNYKIQDKHSETLIQEQKTIYDLINKTYQEILISLSKSIVSQ